jgi:hypothetical protein
LKCPKKTLRGLEGRGEFFFGLALAKQLSGKALPIIDGFGDIQLWMIEAILLAKFYRFIKKLPP